jgi:hypothetical protein
MKMNGLVEKFSIMVLGICGFASCNPMEADTKKMAEIDCEYQRLREGVSGTIAYRPLEEKKALFF